MTKLVCPECGCEYDPRPVHLDKLMQDKGAKPFTHCPICEVELSEIQR